MTRVQRFGGNHTERKLEAVASYLQSYVTVMKKQRFKLSYVDAFAGSGASQPLGEREQNGLLEDDIYDADTIIVGSPIRALNVEPPFDRYIFIDANPENVRSLEDLAAKFPTRSTRVLDGDANAHLISFADFLDREPFERAVVFLDPFGLSVRWENGRKTGSYRKG